jgi:hypothetical protein
MGSKDANGSSINEGIAERKDSKKEGRQQVREKYYLPAEIQEQKVLLEHRSHHQQYQHVVLDT